MKMHILVNNGEGVCVEQHLKLKFMLVILSMMNCEWGEKNILLNLQLPLLPSEVNSKHFVDFNDLRGELKWRVFLRIPPEMYDEYIIL